MNQVNFSTNVICCYYNYEIITYAKIVSTAI